MGTFKERRYSAQDGKSLYYRDYGDTLLERTAVLCLPGLSRNSRDFHDLACHLAKTRRVVCPDYRGRGLSDYDDNPANYHPKALLGDIRHLLVACGIHHFVAIGTSMGGLLAAAFGAMAPSALRGVILNDIGPEIGNAGLGKILSYLGQDNPQDSWQDAITTLREMLPGLNFQSDEEWRSAAEGTFREGKDGKLHIDWDPRIIEPMRRRPSTEELWQLFRSLKMVPALGFRGELSEILSAETFERMATTLPKFQAVTILGAGHTPSLGEPEALVAIDAFLERT
jgi:pimeloyl-ACP methyl ester carboxylesterase